MMNNVTLVGRLTKDVELRYTPNGVAVANATLAVNRPFKNQNGETEVDFINIVVWRKQAENLATYMGKGSLIGITGSIQTRNYEGDDGKRVYVTEVMANQVSFLESSRKSGGQQQGQTQGQQAAQNALNPYQFQNQQNQGGQGFQQQNPQQNQSQQAQQTQQGNPFGGQGEQLDISDDDLPF